MNEKSYYIINVGIYNSAIKVMNEKFYVNNIALISRVNREKSVTHIHVYILPLFLMSLLILLSCLVKPNLKVF